MCHAIAWRFCGHLMNMKAAEPRKRAAETRVEVSQFSPSHSSRDFAACFRGSAAQTPTKPPATQASHAKETRVYGKQ